MVVYNVLYTPIITSDHVFVFGVNGSKTQIYIYDLLNNGTEMKTFPIGVSGAIGINVDGNIYLYVYSNISGYYIYDPFNDMYTYISLEMPREIYAGVDGFTIVQPPSSRS